MHGRSGGVSCRGIYGSSLGAHLSEVGGGCRRVHGESADAPHRPCSVPPSRFLCTRTALAAGHRVHCTNHPSSTTSAQEPACMSVGEGEPKGERRSGKAGVPSVPPPSLPSSFLKFRLNLDQPLTMLAARFSSLPGAEASHRGCEGCCAGAGALRRGPESASRRQCISATQITHHGLLEVLPTSRAGAPPGSRCAQGEGGKRAK